MARQEKTSTRVYQNNKTPIKCFSCGNEVKNIKLTRIKGIARWICTMCHNRRQSRNGN